MLKCIGCDQSIPWAGEGTFCYTCPCGATVFHDEEKGGFILPVSLAIVLRGNIRGNLAHIDYYVGNSPHTSERKEALIKELLNRGSIWMKDCKQCQQDGTLQRILDREKYHAILEAESILRRANEG